MLFPSLQVSWAINIQKNKVILNTYSIVDTYSQYETVCARFFFTSSIRKSDRYVRQIKRAMKTYNFCNFNILGTVQFKFKSPTVLLHILSQSTCFNRLISIEYKNKWNILIISNLWRTSERRTFWQILENQLAK